jgi:DNA-binding response OmpR family regulator
VVLLTALDAEGDRIAGLEHGADDYVTKPFSPRELALRVRAVLRRAAGMSGPRPTGVLHDGELRLDRGSRQVTLGETAVPLTTREFDLLSFLMDNQGLVFDRHTLLSRVWGWEFGDQSTVTVHVRRLRAKIEQDPPTQADSHGVGDGDTATNCRSRDDPVHRLGLIALITTAAPSRRFVGGTLLMRGCAHGR